MFTIQFLCGCREALTPVLFWRAWRHRRDAQSWRAKIFRDEGLGADERYLAELLANRFSVPIHMDLLEVGRTNLIENMLNTPFSLRPGKSGVLAEHDRLTSERCDAMGAKAIFTGDGGDLVFFGAGGVAVLSDRIGAMGSKDFWVHTAQASVLTGHSIWHYIAWIFRLALKPLRPLHHLKSRPNRIATAALREIDPEYLLHPWFRDFRGLPFGKVSQILGLVQSYHTDSDLASLPVPQISPLLSQPVLELFLRTPTYVLVPESIERGLARTAFADLLPREIVERRTKATAENHFVRLISENRQEVSAFLEDGELARRGLLDKHRIRDIVSEPATVDLGRTLEYLTTEAWTRRVNQLGQNFGAQNLDL